MSDRYRVEKHGAAIDRFDVVQDRDEPGRPASFVIFATTRGNGAEGGAHLIAKLLNDHERPPEENWAPDDQPSLGMAACPFCESVYLDGDEAKTCCTELRRDG